MRFAILILALAFLGCAPRRWEAARFSPYYTTRTSRGGECADELTYRCLGALRVRRAIVLGFAQRRRSRSDRELIERAVELDVREAIPYLRAIVVEDPALNHIAAQALGELHDPSSVELLVRFAIETEEVGSGAHGAARDALDAHGVEAALAYAHDWMARHVQLAGIVDVQIAKWAAEVVMRANDASALPTLRAWDAQVEDAAPEQPDRLLLHATLEGARIQLGDLPFATIARRVLGTPDAVVPARPDIVIRGLGYDLADAPGLVRFAGSTGAEAMNAYDGIDRLVSLIAREEAAGGGRARDATRVRAELIEGLQRFTNMREDPDDPNFMPTLVARHHASLARLGSASDAARLLELARDPGFGAAAFVAAREAILIGLPGAADAAYGLFMAGVVDDYGDLFSYASALLDVAAEHMTDGRWSVALFDRWEGLRARALFHMARRLPRDACGAVTEASLYADESAVRPGLTALTTLGPACRTELIALVDRPDASPRVRGAAIEVLAMLRDPITPELLSRDARDDELRWSIAAAQNIVALPY